MMKSFFQVSKARIEHTKWTVNLAVNDESKRRKTWKVVDLHVWALLFWPYVIIKFLNNINTLCSYKFFAQGKRSLMGVFTTGGVAFCCWKSWSKLSCLCSLVLLERKVCLFEVFAIKCDIFSNMNHLNMRVLMMIIKIFLVTSDSLCHEHSAFNNFTLEANRKIGSNNWLAILIVIIYF